MKEFIFRAKRVLDNEWVYGGLIHQTDYYGTEANKYFIIDGTKTYDYDIGEPEAVFEETVEQYIGLIDKNGKKIFEGDIVNVTDGSYSELHVIEYKQSVCTFAFIPISNAYVWLNPTDYTSDNFEVVGNIYDTPELIK